VREHCSRGGERLPEYMYVTGNRDGKAGHKAPHKRVAESGPQGTAQAANTEDRMTHTGNTQTAQYL